MASINLTAEQQAAVHLATTQRLGVFTGGPGTGKTTTVRAIHEALRVEGRSVLLVAPTGKAAARLAEQVGESASTIHRAIGWRPSGEAVYGPHNHLPFDAVIVDESSMIDSILMARLLGCVGPRTSLLLVGDDDQLPPVRAGSPFADLLACRIVPAIRLSAIFRQGEGSPIAEAARFILQGRPPENATRESGAFHWIEVPDEERIPDMVQRIARDRFPAAFDVSGDDHVQALCPGKEGVVSTETLNAALARVFNPERGSARGLRERDKVINTSNDYDLGVFNGDVGRVVRSTRGQAVVDFGDGRQVAFSGSAKIAELLPAWCLTVHRSQGSEYDAVIVALSERHRALLTRKLLYTAVTRASRVCVVVSTARAKRTALGSAGDGRRVTTVQARVRVAVAAATRPTPAL